MGKVDVKSVLEIQWDGPWEVRPIDVNVDFTLNPTCGYGNANVTAKPIDKYSNDWGGKVEIFYYEYSDLVETNIECVGVSDCEGGYGQYGKVESETIVVGVIDASGGTATTTIGNGWQYYTKANGETGKTNDIIPCDISGNPMTSFTVTADSRGTVVGEERIVSSTTVMWYGEDYQRASGIVEVRQAANSVSGTVTTVTAGSAGSATIPASGGSVTVTPTNGTYKVVTTYSSTSTAQTDSGNVTPSPTSFTASATTRGTEVGEEKVVSSTTVTWTKNDVSKTNEAVVKQEENTIIDHVDNKVVLSISASTTSLAKDKDAEATLVVSGTIISGDLYKSGVIHETTETDIPLSGITVSINNTTDFTLSDNILSTKNENKYIEPNECIVTASYETYSSNITIKQVGPPAKYNFDVLCNNQSITEDKFKSGFTYVNITGFTFGVNSIKSGESKTSGAYSENVNWRLTVNGNSVVYINKKDQWVEYDGNFISAKTVHVGEIQPKSSSVLWVKPIFNNLTFTDSLATVLTFIQEGNNDGNLSTQIVYDLTKAKVIKWEFDADANQINIPWSGGTYDLNDSKCTLSYTFVKNGTPDAKYVYTSDYSDSLILSLQRNGKYETYSTVEKIDNLLVTFSPNWCDNLSTKSGQYGCGYDVTLSLLNVLGSSDNVTS